MSQWTHVAGLIRLDNMATVIIRFPGPQEVNEKVKEAIEKALGHTVGFDSPPDSPCEVPCGSEGSLQYQVIKTFSNSSSITWGHVAIWGDLRDFGEEDVSEVTEWFEKSLKRLAPSMDEPKQPPPVTGAEQFDLLVSTFMIRDAVLLVNVEYGKTHVLFWDGEKKTVEER